MPDLKDTYVVHCAMCRCTMGMRESYTVLTNTHGVYLKQQPQMTVKDCKSYNFVNFGGCYSMENPSTKAEAEKIQKEVEEECPDTFLDNVMNFFSGGKKKEAVQNDPSKIEEGQMMVVGKCLLGTGILFGQEWSEGKDGVEIEGIKPVMGEAKIYCKYGGEIQIIHAGQPEAGE